MSFSQLGLSEKVLAAVQAAGYTTPTPIQQQAIPHVLARRDVLGIAQTGTGKTAAFTLPMLTRLENGRARARMPRTLILEPTRELAAQVQESFEKYGAGQKLNVALVMAASRSTIRIRSSPAASTFSSPRPGGCSTISSAGGCCSPESSCW
jgi:superfamily II DNA/RNA helicase